MASEARSRGFDVGYAAGKDAGYRQAVADLIEQGMVRAPCGACLPGRAPGCRDAPAIADMVGGAFIIIIPKETSMDNQHRQIVGYRELDETEIALMNEIKAAEARWNGLIDRLKVTPGIDARQVAIAQTEGESAFMRAVRAVARPERIVDGGVGTSKDTRS